MPAEWEPHRGTWLSWPHKEASWPGRFGNVPGIFGRMVRLLADREEVHINVGGPAMEAEVRSLLADEGARDADAGLFRVGDQAAVIPSLAGEGMAIALASGEMAARAWLAGADAESFQAAFAARAERPLRIAGLIWRIAETDPGARLLAGVAGGAPWLARAAMALTRI